MIFAYNKEHVGDTLLIIVADDQGMKQGVERKGDVAKITTEDGKIVGWNLFSISEKMVIEGNGQVTLSNDQLQTINDWIHEAGFADTILADNEPKFVVGYVQTCEPHPDSDHLSITEVAIDQGKVVQIVCGAPNIRKGLKVVVAKPGAMMPDGLLIWPGELRGVASTGMICSAKELQLPNAPKKRGILELPQDAIVGSAFTK